MSDKCDICGCAIHTDGEYATDTAKGRSHASKHHYVANRFYGHSKNNKGKNRTAIFLEDPWKIKGKTGKFCYDCHEELLHNPVLLPEDLQRFVKLVNHNQLNEIEKTDSKEKLRLRIMLLHEALALGINKLLEDDKI
jgi:hypothetical protein